MASDSFEKFHSSLMQDYLPVGMGLISRAREGGLKKMMEVFKSDEDPVKELGKEGELAASSLRDRLDQFMPGLGHPIMSVDIQVENTNEDMSDLDKDSLTSTLHQLDTHLQKLNIFLEEDLNEEESQSKKS